MNFFKDKYNILGIVIYLAMLLSFYIPGVSREDSVLVYMAVFSVCFVVYWVLYKRNREMDIGVREVLYAAIVLRLLLIATEPVTSDDYYRYLWDGKVQNAGLDPFLYSPLELTELHDDVVYPNITFPEIKTIYPPVSQVIFLAAYFISPGSSAGLKFIYLIFDIGVMLFIFLSLKELKMRSGLLILYAFSPLILLEIFLNAHIDVILIFFLSGCVYFTIKKNPALSLLMLGFSVLSKTYTLIFLPVVLLYFFRYDKSINRIAKNFIFFLFPFLIIYFYRHGILNIFSVMENYMKHWYSNNLIYKIILYLSELTGVNDHSVTRIIMFALFVISYCILLIMNIDLIKKFTFIAIFYFLFSHTVHPWYLCILVMLLPLYLSYASFVWTGIIFLTNFTVYNYLKSGVWEDVYCILFMEYILLIFFLSIDLKKLKNISYKEPERSISV
ncbi:MAG: hypothetical protein IPM38_04535 [Ignavibacteria bacterium]|nr:hypothetical protein [Ignavibacteria bacterium]